MNVLSHHRLHHSAEAPPRAAPAAAAISCLVGVGIDSWYLVVGKHPRSEAGKGRRLLIRARRLYTINTIFSVSG